MSNCSYATQEELALRASIVARELEAEIRRVQSLERNLDIVLRRNGELEAALARTRAMLTIALSDEAIDIEAVRAEFAADRTGEAAALSRALLSLIPVRPTVSAAPI